jgi:hypothetical protein
MALASEMSGAKKAIFLFRGRSMAAAEAPVVPYCKSIDAVDPDPPTPEPSI